MFLRSNANVNKFLDRTGAITIEEAYEFIDKIESGIKNHAWLYWAISQKGNNNLIGTICLWNMKLEKEMAEIGYELFPAFQGKGIMREALTKVIDFGFNSLGLKVITALPHVENTKSIDLLLRNHFRLDEEFAFVSKEEADGLAVYYLTRDTT